MQVEDWGLIPYQEALQKQYLYRDQILNGERSHTLVLCSHPPVVTLGKKSTPQDLIGWQGEVVTVARGGKATYHGPEQIILYPLLNLEDFQKNLGGHLRCLEQAVVATLNQYNLRARGNPDYAGVWVQGSTQENLTEKKIASIGIAVHKWVTYHGLSFNYQLSEQAFSGILACGYQYNVMTSLEKCVTLLPSREQVQKSLVDQYMQLMGKSFLSH